MSDINEIGGDNTTSLITKNGTTSVKQDTNVSDFKAFQRKVAEKSMFRRVIGVATGVFGGAGAAVGGIFAIKIGVAAMVGALAGLVGAAVAPFVLIGMGALCIASIVFLVKSRIGNIYSSELNKLLQNGNTNDKERAIFYLNEMLCKCKKGTVEYETVKGFLKENIKRISNDPQLKPSTDLLFRTILNSDNSDNCKFGIQLLIKIVEGNGNDNKAKEIFENGILNLGLIKKMIYYDGCKKEMIKLLSLMSNDKGPNEQNEINGDKRKHLNEIVVDLVGSEIAEKLGKLNLGNDDSGYLNENNVNEIVEGIKSLKMTIPAKLKEGDIVYKGDFSFNEKLSVLEKNKNTEEISKKIFKSFEKKDSTNKDGNQTKLKSLLSQNNGLEGDGDKPNSNFLSNEDQEYNKDNNNFDKNKIKEKGSADYERNLVSMKFESEKYIFSHEDGQNFLKAFEKVDVQEVPGNKEDNKNDNGDKKEPENVSNLEKFFGKIKNQKGINDNKIGTLEKLKDRIFSFPGQCTQAAVMTFFQNELKIPLFTISSSYEIVNSQENGTTITVHNVFTASGENLYDMPVNLQIVIDEVSVFRLNDQKENEYVPITPLESHVNVHEADILYPGNKYENTSSTKAVRIGKKITSVDWKNEEKVNKVEK